MESTAQDVVDVDQCQRHVMAAQNGKKPKQIITTFNLDSNEENSSQED